MRGVFIGCVLLGFLLCVTAVNPCEHGGTLLDIGGDCNCTSEWMGVNCSEPLACEECDLNGTACAFILWEGDIVLTTICEAAVNCSQVGACLNNGTCVDGLDATPDICECPIGWIGADCGASDVACDADPCPLGAICLASVESPNFVCVCPLGDADPFCDFVLAFPSSTGVLSSSTGAQSSTGAGAALPLDLSLIETVLIACFTAVLVLGLLYCLWVFVVSRRVRIQKADRALAAKMKGISAPQ